MTQYISATRQLTTGSHDLGITDKAVIAEVQKTQKMMSDILTELTE